VTGHGYYLTTNNANVAAGQTLTIDGSGLSGGSTMNINGMAERDGSLVMLGSDGGDALTGGFGADSLRGGGGSDYLNGQRGADTFVYGASTDSTGVDMGYDQIVGFDAAADKFDLGASVTGIDHKITKGALSTEGFTDSLATAVNAHHLDVGHAVLFTPDSGDFAGTTFLIVDTNGTAGYQTDDLLIQLTGAVHLTSLDTGDFI
jgi:Ca2+-binding RTX toxin-like protein